MITWVKKNRMLLLKIAAVAAYFIFAAYGMISYSVLPDFESRWGVEEFTRGTVMISLLLYLFTWLYKWAIRGKVRGWHVQSVLIVVCGLGIRLLLDAAYVFHYPMGSDAFGTMLLYHGYISWIALLAIMLLAFFVLDRRRAVLGKTSVQKGISIALVVLLISFAILIIVTIQGNTPMEPVKLDNVIALLGAFTRGVPQWDLSTAVEKCVVVWNLMFFFLLWINTKPAADKTLLQETLN